MLLNEILDSSPCKVKNTNPNLHRWKNWDPNTPFAPIFDVPIWMEDLDTDFIDRLISEIQENKVGSERDSWRVYNIFDWKTTSTRSLQSSILKSYIEYIDSIQYETENPEDVWIRGWGVVLEPGQHLPKHSHSYHENTFISGNVMLSDNKTYTEYFIPHLSDYYGPWRCENIPGRMTLFPSWVLHGVLPTEYYRVSIGFDLYTSHTMNYILKNRIVGDMLQESILKSIKLV